MSIKTLSIELGLNRLGKIFILINRLFVCFFGLNDNKENAELTVYTDIYIDLKNALQ